MRRRVSSQQSRPPSFLFSGRQSDSLLINEWRLVLRGDGKSPRTIGNYLDTVRQLSSFLVEGGFPAIAQASAEHLRSA